MEFYIKKYEKETAQTADISFLPAMARRKLTTLDKTALSVMNKCCREMLPDNLQSLKLVFASQYGELERLKKLVAQYTEENEVSPATFSGSVHNAVIGQFSLLNKITQSYNSISAENYTFEAGLIEAIITANDCDVLYCYCDSMEKDDARAFACLIQQSDYNNAVLNDGCVSLFDGDLIWK